MTLSKNDPLLTAFVLDELPEKEKLEVEAALEKDAELRSEVDAIRRTVFEIEDFMKSEPVLVSNEKISPAKQVDQAALSAQHRGSRFPVGLLSLLVLAGLGVVLFGLTMSKLQTGPRISKQESLADAMPGAPNAFEQAEPIRENLASGESVQEKTGYDGSFVGQDRKSLPTLSEPNLPQPVVIGTELKKEEPARQRKETSSKPASVAAPVMPVPSTAPAPDNRFGRPGQVVPMSRPSIAPESGDRDSSRRFTRAFPAESRKSDTGPQSFGMKGGTTGAMDSGMGARGMIGGGMGGGMQGMGALGGRIDPSTQMATRFDATVHPERQLNRGSKVSGPENDVLHFRSNAGRLHYSHDYAADEAYGNFVENEFLKPQDAPFSTFSIDVDTAAYATMRRYVQAGQRPPVESVRLEEYVNYFKYDYAPPRDGKPFATAVDVAPCPWEPKHLIARIGIKGKEFDENSDENRRPPLNLVFLIDVSGSMSSSNRLPLVKRGLTELVEMLQPQDRVAIVTYAGSSRLALPSVSGREKRAILDSIDALEAAGSTAGEEGIRTAYKTAREYYKSEAQNRVILCTDGDFNVGVTDNAALERLIGDEAKSGVYLTVLGFGMGNYKDDRLKTLSMRGNGNYGYIDTIEEARRLLVRGLTGTLIAIAGDVKVQVDFNPKQVAGYRLLGYENRKLRDEDFHDDRIDAGEIGAGHTVTALYEIIPVGAPFPGRVDRSRYAEPERGDADEPAPESGRGGELMFVKLRYKEPDSGKSALSECPVPAAPAEEWSTDTQFAAAVALYGMLLRESRYAGRGDWDMVLELARPGLDDDSYRKEFVELVEKVKGFENKEH